MLFGIWCLPANLVCHQLPHKTSSYLQQEINWWVVQTITSSHCPSISSSHSSPYSCAVTVTTSSPVLRAQGKSTFTDLHSCKFYSNLIFVSHPNSASSRLGSLSRHEDKHPDQEKKEKHRTKHIFTFLIINLFCEIFFILRSTWFVLMTSHHFLVTPLFLVNFLFHFYIPSLFLIPQTQSLEFSAYHFLLSSYWLFSKTKKNLDLWLCAIILQLFVHQNTNILKK